MRWGRAPAYVVVGDFNGDGIPDLAATVSGSDPQTPGTVRIMLGQGDGTFQTLQNYTVGEEPTSIGVGDFNGDGVLDLAVINYTSWTVSILLGYGDGSFQAARDSWVGGIPTGVQVGDFNRDSFQDLAVTSRSYAATNLGFESGNLSIFLGNGDGTFRAPQTYGVSNTPTCIAVGDFNGDGFPDWP